MITFLRTKIANFLRQEDGPTAVEYSVMLALIIVTCIGAINTLGGAPGAMFSNISTQMQNFFPN